MQRDLIMDTDLFVDHDWTPPEKQSHLEKAAPVLLKACRLALVRLESGPDAERKINAGIAKVLRDAVLLAETGKKAH